KADIVNVGSTIGFKAYENQCDYVASKYAVCGVNESLKLELKDTGARIIGFHPGGFKSRLHEKAIGKELDLSPFMEPKDLAKLMIFILELPKSVEVTQIIINRKPTNC
ncbi:MAG: SDR family oxidoreductase, partial [archaeon]